MLCILFFLHITSFFWWYPRPKLKFGNSWLPWRSHHPVMSNLRPPLQMTELKVWEDGSELRCTTKAHIWTAWSPADGTVGGVGNFRRWSLVEGRRSLGGMPSKGILGSLHLPLCFSVSCPPKDEQLRSNRCPPPSWTMPPQAQSLC
jgi:hypothetical protein